MKIVIEKRKNFEHVIGKEFKEEYTVSTAKKEINSIIAEYEIFREGELDLDERNEIEAVENLKAGMYDFDCGDFTYYITIAGNIIY